MYYSFWDHTSIPKYVEYDIAGEDYKKLIHCCAKYAAFFSLSFTRNPAYKCKEPPFAPVWSKPYGDSHYLSHRNFYPCNEATISYLETHVNGIFEWVQCWGFENPEDLTFYREDGTVLFWLWAHEGQAALFPRESEDVSQIVSMPGWEPCTSIYAAPLEHIQQKPQFCKDDFAKEQ